MPLGGGRKKSVPLVLVDFLRSAYVGEQKEKDRQEVVLFARHTPRKQQAVAGHHINILSFHNYNYTSSIANMVENKPDAVESALEKAKPLLAKVTFGGVVGYCSGYASKKISKAAAIMIGVAFMVVQGAAYAGYIEVNWSAIKDSGIKKIDTVRTTSARCVLLVIHFCGCAQSCVRTGMLTMCVQCLCLSSYRTRMAVSRRRISRITGKSSRK